ncbi:hypothetical protein Plim_2579 [Planctopirus limnophila DSM 3776]|uniref:Uncharacterized protein n=2 Tax=Planctopirus limnophila TaxID=120 RepID=D5SQ29_PLAL2|nr:hypothetical protein Plim_2579 [Planctopirus limnophila DSM 3776]
MSSNPAQREPLWVLNAYALGTTRHETSNEEAATTIPLPKSRIAASLKLWIHGGFLTFLFLSLVSHLGCQQSASATPDPLRCEISGEVLMDGQPLDGASIAFVSVDTQAPQTATANIIGGRFSLPHTNGPFPGRNQIMILPNQVDEAEAIERSKAAQGKPFSLDQVKIPAAFRRNSKLFFNVSLTGSNRLKLELGSKGEPAKITIAN